MARYQFGWFDKKLYFTKEETDNFADAATATAITAAAIPDPVVSKVVAMYAGTVSLLARRASRKGRALGLRWLGGPTPFPYWVPIPFFHDEVE